MRLLGLDPGLRRTGWGVIEAEGNRLNYVASGVVCSAEHLSLAERLVQLHDGVMAVIACHRPNEAAVEEIFVNRNPVSTLKLSQARGVVLLAPARAGLSVSEYKPTLIKKAIVGGGHAQKIQVAVMVERLLPGYLYGSIDAADALAVAICHAHHRATAARLAESENGYRKQGG